MKTHKQYRIKEYTNSHGVRKYQIQEKRWWGWVDSRRWFYTELDSLQRAQSRLRLMITSDIEEATNKAKKTEYHYE